MEQPQTADQLYQDSEEARAEKNMRDLLRDLIAADNRPVNEFKKIQEEVEAEFVTLKVIRKEVAQETQSALSNAVKKLEKDEWIHKNGQHIIYPRRAAA